MIITFSLQSYLLIQPTVIFCKAVRKSIVSKTLLLVFTSIKLKMRMRNSKSQSETYANFVCMKLGKYSMKNYVIFCSSYPFLPLIQRKTSKQVAYLSLQISLNFSSYSSLYEKYDEEGLISRLCRQTNMSTFFTLLNASFTLDLNDSDRKGQDLRNESITPFPFSHDQQSSFSMYSKKTRLVAYSSMIIFNQVLLYSADRLACQYNLIKLMSRLTNDQPSLPIRVQDITAHIPPSRIQLYRPVNPELTPLRQNKSDVYRYGDKEENIISPFQKDQFLNEYEHPHLQKRLYAAGQGIYPRTNTRQFQTRSKITSTIPQVIKLQEMPLGKQGLSKSWTNHHNQTEHRETVTYLEQIINDLSDKKQFQLTRRYIQKLQNPHLRQKLQIVVSKIQSKESSKTAEFIVIRDMLTKILRNYFKYERNIQLASTQRLVKQLQKAVSKQMKEEIRVTRKESQQKVKQLKEESKLLNSKLQRQTKELYKALQQEKSKMKESYEQIYRRIYEENNKLKKEFQAKEAELRQEKSQAQNVKNKYESIFNEISLRFNDVKLQYGKLINASSKQTEKNKDLKEEIRFITEKLRLQEMKSKQLQAEMANQVKKYCLLEDEKIKLEEMSFKYKDYAQKFLAQTKKYQNQRFEREKVQSQLKEVQSKSIRKNEQQQQYANDLQVSIKANQQILTQQLHKIQQNESIYQDKVKNLEAVLKETQLAQASVSSYQDRIHKLQQQQANLQESMRRLNKDKKHAQEKHAKLQELIMNLNVRKKNVQEKYTEMQESIRALNKDRKDAQEGYTNLQEKQSIITKMINNHEQAYIKLNEDIKSKEKVKENLQREITIVNQEILSKKQKLLSLKIQGETQQIKNRSHLTQMNSISRQIQAKKIQLDTLASKIAAIHTQHASLDQKIANMHLNIANLQRQKEYLQAEQSSINHKIQERKSKLQEINHKIEQQQTTFKQCFQELSTTQQQISSSKIEHAKLQQCITAKNAQLSNLQYVFTQRKDLMGSIQNKMMQLQYSLQNLEKSNEGTVKQPLSKTASQPEQQDLFETDTLALQLVRKSLQSCIQSLKSQKTKASEQLQSLRKSLHSHEKQFSKKDQQLQKINEELQAKYVQFVVMDEHLLSKKKELQTLR